eukprot:4663845-Pleurochrysis_carterae.AAC.1
MRSSAIACLRVRGSVDTLLTANAQPVPRPHTGLSARARVRSRAEGWQDRRGEVPRLRWKCGGVGGCCGASGARGAEVALVEVTSGVAGVSQRVTVDRAGAETPADAGGGALRTGGLLEDVTVAATLSA